MNADSLLNFRIFAHTNEVSNYCNKYPVEQERTKDQGKVLIQTYNPYHQILQQVAANNYAQMYTDQRGGTFAIQVSTLFSFDQNYLSSQGL